MNDISIMDKNKNYWNANADQWFGKTSLPVYGVKFVTENELHFFDGCEGKKSLEICCGSGHSIKYLADKGMGELWGVDMSQKQLDNAQKYLSENGYSPKLICSPMEKELDVPHDYFDYVYSIYGIGWTTDLQGTFDKIASYLKKDGLFIFSWNHTLYHCVAWAHDGSYKIENSVVPFTRSYFDESYFTMPVDGSEIVLSNRKISTYINALAKAGFKIEHMVEQSDKETMEATGDIDDKTRKAQLFPITFCIKARKL